MQAGGLDKVSLRIVNVKFISEIVFSQTTARKNASWRTWQGHSEMCNCLDYLRQFTYLDNRVSLRIVNVKTISNNLYIQATADGHAIWRTWHGMSEVCNCLDFFRQFTYSDNRVSLRCVNVKIISENVFTQTKAGKDASWRTL